MTPASSNKPKQMVVEVESLKISYDGHVAVAGISLAVEKGEIFGFLGPNGAGKTSTMRALMGLLRPDAGVLSWFGQTMVEPSPEIRRRIGFLPGDLSLPTFLNGNEVLDFFADLQGRPAVLRDEFLEHLGFDCDALSRKIRTYSTGMRQMIGLATAVQHDPALLILDEPTTGLDPLVREALIQWLKARSEVGKTVLFSSHVLPEVEACADRIALIHRGQIRFHGALQELAKNFPRRVQVTTKNGERISFEHEGSAADLLKRIEDLQPDDFQVQAADLATLFHSLGATGENQE